MLAKAAYFAFNVVEHVIALLILLILAAICFGSEPPPQCNLPGWGMWHKSVWVITETPARVPSALVVKLPPIIKVAAPTYTKQVVGYRNPVSHTHSCPKCGVVWDHRENTSHNCARCGTYVSIQDARPRIVTILGSVANASVPQARAQARAPQQAPAFVAFTRASAAGCANGQCSFPR